MSGILPKLARNSPAPIVAIERRGIIPTRARKVMPYPSIRKRFAVDPAGISLRWPLVILFVLQTVGATALVGYLSYRSGQMAIEDLADRLLQQTSARVHDRLVSFLTPPQQIVAANRLSVEVGALDPNDRERVRRQLWQEMVVNPNIPANAFLSARGTGLGYGRLLSKEEEYFAQKLTGRSLPIGTLYLEDSSPRGRRLYLVDRVGEPTELIYTFKGDFRDLPSYRQARSSGEQHWTPISINSAVPLLQVMAIAPVHEATGKFQGFFIVNYLLAKFSAFLHQLRFSPTGQVFILDRSGTLIATSVLSEASGTREVNGKPARLPAIESGDERMRETAKELLRRFGSFRNLREGQQLKVRVNGEEQFARVTLYRDRYGLDWSIVTVVPASDFMAEIEAARARTVVLCVLTLLITLALGLWLVQRVIAPLHRLNVSAGEIAGNRFDNEVSIVGFGEVRQLSIAFRQMAEQLRSYFQLRTDYERDLEKQVAERTAELARSRDLREAIFNESTDAIFLVEPSSNPRILDCNQRAVELFEVADKSELIGIPGTNLQKRPYRDSELADIVRELAEKGFWSREIEYVTRKGREFWGNLAAKPIRVAGQAMQLVRLTDISDRRRAEERLRRTERWLDQYSRQSPGNIYTLALEPDGSIRFEYVSSAIETMHEITPTQALDDARIVLDQIHPDDRDAYWQAANRSAENLELFSHEWRIVTPSGKVKWLQGNSQPERRDNGAIVWHGVIQDVTDRHKLDEMKDEFVAVVSHELRTPLASIRGSLGLLESGALNDRPEKVDRVLQIARENTDRLARLVNDILDLQRLKSGTVPLVKETCPVSDLMGQAVESVRAIADLAGIILHWTPLAVSVKASPDSIARTLTNLLGNAIKFSPPDSAIELKAEVRNGMEREGISSSYILFSIVDRGRGIPPDKLELIFERFQQVDLSDSYQKGGTGLGLAICKTIVEQHGGKIWVESVFGRGSTFYFTLPMD
ncbi:ATP-binding protein [Pannus brasiliensis CCIBt3594]|uniref:histidine kinase n=1 Tax=Pannus brasiliensis CCIBt3594 TaxID=1427578 RepID=A0AAW9R1U1_9CHRO